VGTNARADTVQIGTTAVNTGNTQSINIGNLAAAGTTNVTIGTTTGATAGTTTIQGLTSLLLGNATTPTITLQTAASGSINIGTNAVANTIQLGATTGTAAQVINIGNNATASSLTTVNIGSTVGTSGTTIQAGGSGITLTGAVSASSTMNAVSGFLFNGTAGSTTTCSSGGVLQNGVIQGGIVTGGTCIAPSLQNAYDTSSSPASILLADAKDFVITAADTSTDPSILFNLQCVTSCGSNGRFAIQNGGSDVFLVNSNTGSIRVGDVTNNVTFTAGTYEPVLNGNARHNRQVTLTAEYAGGSMTADGTNNTGTMTSDNMTSTPYRNFYKWVNTQGTAQDYDVWVRYALPSDWGGFASGQTICLDTYASATTANGVTFTLYKMDNGSGTNLATILTANDLTPTSTATWQNKCTSSISGGSYVANGYLIMDIKMTAPATTGDIRIGDITLNYLSKW
jgi:hypothetical protein